MQVTTGSSTREHTSRLSSVTKNPDTRWIIGDDLHRFSVKVHIVDEMQLGESVIEEVKVR